MRARTARRLVASAAVAAAVASAIAACAASPRRPEAGGPEGFALAAADLPMAPALATLTGGVVPTPVALAVARYDDAAPGATGSITRTVATFESPSGALAAYNGWFARYGFPAVAVRKSLDLGDMAESYTMDWPPLHAVLVRDGDRFVLVEGDDAVPAARREPAMATLAADGLAAAVATPIP